MSKTHADTVPRLEPSSAQVATQIVHLLDASREATHMSTAEHFSHTLAIWQAALDQVDVATWLPLCEGMEYALGPLRQALALLVQEAETTYHDILGPVYMLLSQTDKRLGQYFTPFAIARMMARVLVVSLPPPQLGAAPKRILEPTCGSGVMILAMAEALEERWPGSVLGGYFQFFGIDLDPICVAMCRLNMRLHSIGRIARCVTDLSPSERAAVEQATGEAVSYAFQPAALLQGNALEEHIYREFTQERRWIPLQAEIQLAPPPPSLHAEPQDHQAATVETHKEAEEQVSPVETEGDCEPSASPEDTQQDGCENDPVTEHAENTDLSPAQQPKTAPPVPAQQHLF